MWGHGGDSTIFLYPVMEWSLFSRVEGQMVIVVGSAVSIDNIMA